MKSQSKSKRAPPTKNTKTTTNAASATITHLPVKVLSKIFSFLSSRELLRLEQVSRKWREVMAESSWKQRRSISEDDIDAPNAPLILQLENLLQLVSRFSHIDYCFVPPRMRRLFSSAENDGQFIFRAFYSLCQLAIHVRRKLLNGAMPFHCDLICFSNEMSDIIESCQYYELSHLLWDFEDEEGDRDDDDDGDDEEESSKCRTPERWLMRKLFHRNGYVVKEFKEIRSYFELCHGTVIIASWRIRRAAERCAGASMLIKSGFNLSLIRDLVLEHLESESDVHFYKHNVDPTRWTENLMIVRVLRQLAPTARVHVKRLIVHCLPTEMRFDIRFKKGIFKRDELISLVKTMNTFSESDGCLLVWQCIVDTWHASGLIADVTIGTKIPRFANMLFKEAFKSAAKRRLELSVMPLVTATFLSLSRSLDITESCDYLVDLLVDLYRQNHVLFHLQRLRVKLVTSYKIYDEVDTVHFPDTSLPVAVFWRGLVVPHGLEALRSLSVDVSAISDDHSRKYPTLPTRKAPLPHLEHLVVEGIVDLPHLLSVLQRAPRLRHLRLKLAVDHPPETRDERFEWTRKLLAGIARKKQLVSLSIAVRADNQEESDEKQQLWLDTWLEGVDTTAKRDASFSHRRVKPKLRQPVLDCLMALPVLQHLDLSFNVHRCYPHAKTALLMDDEDALLAEHPQLCYVRINDGKAGMLARRNWRIRDLERLVRRCHRDLSEDSDESDGWSDESSSTSSVDDESLSSSDSDPSDE